MSDKYFAVRFVQLGAYFQSDPTVVGRDEFNPVVFELDQAETDTDGPKFLSDVQAQYPDEQLELVEVRHSFVHLRPE